MEQLQKTITYNCSGDGYADIIVAFNTILLEHTNLSFKQKLNALKYVELQIQELIKE